MVKGHYILDVIENNKLLFGLMGTALVVTAPEPGVPWNLKTLYKWIFDGAHQFLNMKRPTMPVTPPAQPKQ